MTCIENGIVGEQTDIGCIPTDPLLFVAKFYAIGLGIIGGVALLSIIYGAYVIMTSGGNPTQLQKGKSYIFYSIVGLLLAIGGFIVTRVITVDVLHIPGFG